MENNLMKLGETASEVDEVDLDILSILQENCKLSLARIGRKVGLSAPSVVERIKKLEGDGVIQGYAALLDARRLGKDVTAFIGVSVTHVKMVEEVAATAQEMKDVLECHHVTGEFTFLLKVKTENTRTLEKLIRRIRSIEGVGRTETMIALSTPTERVQLALNSRVHISASPRLKRVNGRHHNAHRGASAHA